MTVTKKTSEVKEDIIDVEAEEMTEKESVPSKIKAKVESGKGRLSRNSKKIKTIAVAGLSAIALGAVAAVINNRLGDGGGYTDSGAEGTFEDGAPFDDGSES